jgi:hypothetical protein
MSTYRQAGLILLACAAGLALAACSAGVSTVTPPTPATSGSAASHPAAASSAASGTVSLGGSIGAFPLPPGATVLDNLAYTKSKELVLTGVTPAAAVSFYTTALPRAGYTITMNGLSSTGTGVFAGIEFTGHGYMGTIGAGSGLATPGVSLPSGNAVFIVLTPQ